LYSKALLEQSREVERKRREDFGNTALGGSVRTRKTTEITIETKRLVVVNYSKVSVVSWCPRCSQQTKMITVDEAATVAGVSSRTIYRWADVDTLHFTETSEGRLLICLKSITGAGSVGLTNLQP
jgi:excisionase family DNA binding protein